MVGVDNDEDVVLISRIGSRCLSVSKSANFRPRFASTT